MSTTCPAIFNFPLRLPSMLPHSYSSPRVLSTSSRYNSVLLVHIIIIWSILYFIFIITQTSYSSTLYWLLQLASAAPLCVQRVRLGAIVDSVIHQPQKAEEPNADTTLSTNVNIQPSNACALCMVYGHQLAFAMKIIVNLCNNRQRNRIPSILSSILSF